VPPFPSEQAVEILERALGQRAHDVFAAFDRTPLAAASVAQVHGARLKSGEAVVVKLLRPKVRAMIKRDVEVLRAVAQLAERYSGEARRLRPIEVVGEFEKTLFNELDLMREAANASQLRRNFAGSKKLYIPVVHWEHCRADVLTMERVFGVPISDRETLEARGTDIKRLAEDGVEIFFTQVFRHNFFHADMHPGNIFVDTTRPAEPRYLAVDFGIVGTLSPRDQHYLAENFLAFFKRDYRRVATLHVDSGWVPPGTRVDELESAVRSVCEPIFNKPLKDISFGVVLMRLFETAREFHMEVQPQLVLLQKTLLNIEGLGRQLYPELDLWKTAKPILEEWTAQRANPFLQLSRVVANWPEVNEDLLLLPGLVHRALRRGDTPPEHPPAGPQGREERRRLQAPRGLPEPSAGAALLLAGVLWIGLDAVPPWLGWVFLAVGLLWMFARRRR
jgi:ubiquinone biosynthesis protein